MKVLALLMVVMLAFGAQCVGSNERSNLFNEIEAAQKLIESLSSSMDKEQMKPVLDEIRGVCENDTARVLGQLVLFELAANSTEEAMKFYLALGAFEYSRVELAEAAVQLLDVADGMQLKELHDLLRSLDVRAPDDLANFGIYKDILQRNSNDLPTRLLEYMFMNEPSDAMKVLAEIQYSEDNSVRRALVDADAAISNYTRRGYDAEPALVATLRGEAASAIEALKKRDEPWISFYVGQRLKQAPELANSAVAPD